MEIRQDEEKLKVPTFRSILFERLAVHGITREVAETVLEEIAITTAIYMHKLRRAEREAIDAAKRLGRVIHLEPGQRVDEDAPKPKKRDVPAVEL